MTKVLVNKNPSNWLTTSPDFGQKLTKRLGICKALYCYYSIGPTCTRAVKALGTFDVLYIIMYSVIKTSQ
jgi:hypothetical protein